MGATSRDRSPREIEKARGALSVSRARLPFRYATHAHIRHCLSFSLSLERESPFAGRPCYGCVYTVFYSRGRWCTFAFGDFERRAGDRVSLARVYRYISENMRERGTCREVRVYASRDETLWMVWLKVKIVWLREINDFWFDLFMRRQMLSNCWILIVG